MQRCLPLGDKQRWCICARARIYALLMSDYVRGRTTSLPTRKCLRRRDEETFGKRLRSERAFFLRFFCNFFSLNFFSFFPPSRSLARSVRAGSDFASPFVETELPVTLSPFVSHAKALITLFRVGRRNRGY